MSDQVRYVVFDLLGEILASGECSPDQVELQAREGASAVEGVGERATHCVIDGQVVAYTPQQAAAKAARPSAKASWSNGTMSWTDLRTLDDIKAVRWGHIKAARDAAEFGGFTWGGSAFDSDRESQARIMGAVQMATLAAAAEQPFAIDWTLEDNSVRQLSGAEMVAAGLALGEHVAASHATARGLREALQDAATAEEVEAINWPGA